MEFLYRDNRRILKSSKLNLYRQRESKKCKKSSWAKSLGLIYMFFISSKVICMHEIFFNQKSPSADLRLHEFALTELQWQPYGHQWRWRQPPKHRAVSFSACLRAPSFMSLQWFLPSSKDSSAVKCVLLLHRPMVALVHSSADLLPLRWTGSTETKSDS